MAEAAKRHLVFGDSFVVHLDRFERERFPGGATTVKGTRVDFRGYGGADVPALRHRLRELPIDYYRTVALVIGSNDLCRKDSTAESVVNNILSLANILVNEHRVHKVVVCQILQRNRATDRHFQVSRQEYRSRVTAVNAMLKEGCRHPVYFWKHDCRVRSEASLYVDGVHLNKHGNLFLSRRIRRAISAHGTA